mgnify:CR=1 FL=1
MADRSPPFLRCSTLRDQIAAYVLPDHYFYQVDPEAEDLQKPVGVLLLEVVEARKVGGGGWHIQGLGAQIGW